MVALEEKKKHAHSLNQIRHDECRSVRRKARCVTITDRLFRRFARQNLDNVPRLCLRTVEKAGDENGSGWGRRTRLSDTRGRLWWGRGGGVKEGVRINIKQNRY